MAATRPRHIALLAAAALLPAVLPASAETKPKVQRQSGTIDAAGAYQLSAEELTFDCKRLSGKMQVRILQIRDYDPARQTSAVGTALQTMHNPFIGGSTRGMDRAAEHRADLAMLHAYNRRLAEKKCRTFDLDAELKPQPVTHTPRPQAPAPKK